MTEKPDNVIELRPKHGYKLLLTEEAVRHLILAIATISNTTGIMEECKDDLPGKGFPCGKSCGCYTHMLSSMALEVIFSGPKEKTAKAAIFSEYEHIEELMGADSPPKED